MAKKTISEGTLTIIRDFIGENWPAFRNHCQNHGIDDKEAKDIYEEIGGED